MASVIGPFDPTTAASGQFNIGLVNGGWLFIHNESPVVLQLTVNVQQGAFLVSAYSVRCVHVELASTVVTWKKLNQILAPYINAPISSVYAETYDPGEWSGGEGYWPLSRQLMQPRVVSVPVALSQHTTTTVVMANDPEAFPVTPSGSPLVGYTITPNQIFHVYMWNYTVEALTVGSCRVEIMWWQMTGVTPIASKFVGSVDFVISRAGGMGPSEGTRMALPNPKIFGASAADPAANAVGAFVRLVSGNGGMTVLFSFDAFADRVNNLYPWQPGEAPLLIPSQQDVY